MRVSIVADNKEQVMGLGRTPHIFPGEMPESVCVSATPVTLSIAELIRRNFLRPEIAYLIERPRFRAALAATRRPEDFDELHKLSLELLRQQAAPLAVRAIASHLLISN